MYPAALVFECDCWHGGQEARNNSSSEAKLQIYK